MNKLSQIQSEIKAPKGQFNSFGKYKYRSCEDIVEAVKPVINPLGFSLILSDEIAEIGGRIYVKATATLTDGKETYTSTAYAREEEAKKGMDASQVTGASSSYARKYALNGLFAIDDTKDSDATNTHDKEPKKETAPFQPQPEPLSKEDEPALKAELRKLLRNAKMDEATREASFISLDLINDYDTVTKWRNKLETLQPTLDEIINPNQSDINKHLKNGAQKKPVEA